MSSHLCALGDFFFNPEVTHICSLQKAQSVRRTVLGDHKQSSSRCSGK